MKPRAFESPEDDELEGGSVAPSRFQGVSAWRFVLSLLRANPFRSPNTDSEPRSPLPTFNNSYSSTSSQLRSIGSVD
jgi:hypothetical protein